MDIQEVVAHVLKHRTLVRFEWTFGPMAVAVVPAWDSQAEIGFKLDDMPEELAHILETSELPYRCYARVNLAAKTKEDLCPTNWELGHKKPTKRRHNENDQL